MKKPTKYEEILASAQFSRDDWADPATVSWVNDYKRKTKNLGYSELKGLEARVTKLIPQVGIVVLNGKTYVYTPVRLLAWVCIVPLIWIKVRMNQIIKEFAYTYETKQRKIEIGHTFFEPKGGFDPLAPSPYFDQDGNISINIQESVDKWQKREEAKLLNRVKRTFLKVVGGGNDASFPVVEKKQQNPLIALKREEWEVTDEDKKD